MYFLQRLNFLTITTLKRFIEHWIIHKNLNLNFNFITDVYVLSSTIYTEFNEDKNTKIDYMAISVNRGRVYMKATFKSEPILLVFMSDVYIPFRNLNLLHLGQVRLYNFSGWTLITMICRQTDGLRK